MKFFKRPPKKCSVCHAEKPIFKSLRQGLTQFHYCEDCYNDYYKKIEDRVKKQVMEAVKAGKTITMQDALDITKTITAEVEKENEVKNDGEQKTGTEGS